MKRQERGCIVDQLVSAAREKLEAQVEGFLRRAADWRVFGMPGVEYMRREAEVALLDARVARLPSATLMRLAEQALSIVTDVKRPDSQLVTILSHFYDGMLRIVSDQEDPS